MLVAGKAPNDPAVAAADVHGRERSVPSVEQALEHDLNAGGVTTFHAFVPTDVGPFAEQIRGWAEAHA